MSRIKQVYILVLFLLYGCSDSNLSKWGIIVSDYESSLTSFLVLNIAAHNDSMSIAMQNYDIYHEFREDFGLTKENYVAKMSSVLENGSFIEVEDSTFEILKEYAIYKSSYVDSVFARGDDAAIAYFFGDNLQLDLAISRTEYYYLIKVLFDRGYYVTIAGFTPKLALHPKIAPFDSLASVLPDSGTAPRIWIQPSDE